MSFGDTRCSPGTKPAEEASSAMVSHNAIFQSLMRESMSSRDGARAAVAASTSSSVQVVGKEERPRDLASRIQISRRGYRLVFEHLHLVEQVTVIWIVDAHHLL